MVWSSVGQIDFVYVAYKYSIYSILLLLFFPIIHNKQLHLFTPVLPTLQYRYVQSKHGATWGNAIQYCWEKVMCCDVILPTWPFWVFGVLGWPCPPTSCNILLTSRSIEKGLKQKRRQQSSKYASWGKRSSGDDLCLLFCINPSYLAGSLSISMSNRMKTL